MMMAAGRRKLQEVNHSSFLSRKLWSYSKQCVLTDLTLHCRGGQLTAHRAVLAGVIRMAGLDTMGPAGDDLDTLIIPDVDVSEVELALEMLYLKFDAEKIMSIICFCQIKTEEFLDGREVVETKLEIEDDNNVTEYECETYTDISSDHDHAHSQDSIKTEGNESENNHLENKSGGQVHETLTKKENKNGRGRPKGCTDKTKRKTYTFECKVCDKDIKGRLAYRKHMRKYHGMADKKSVEMAVKTQCPYCEKLLANIYIFHSHVAHLHRKEAFLYHPEIEFKKTCEDCNERFFNICDLGKHTKEVHGKITRKFRCNFCSDEFGDKGGLKNHRLMLHMNELSESGITGFVKNIPCPYCDRLYSLKSQLRGHIFKKHSDKLQLHPEIKPKHECKPCNESFFAKVDLTAHNALCHGEEFECNFCDMKFKHQATRNSHIELIHNTDTHICEICSNIFKTKSAIKAHMKRHSDQPLYKYPCNQCTRGSQSEESLKKHIEAHHQGHQFMCSFCPSTFFNDEVRSMHETRLHSEKTILCEHCDKKFAKTYLLNAHVREVHIKKKDKQCPFCQEEFYDLTTFQCHVNRHTNNRPFACETCGKAFLTSRDLKKHLDVHLLPHQCNICEKKFSSRGVLEDHMRKHAGVKLDCRHNCGHSYMDRRGRERHEKSCRNNPQQGVTWGAIRKQMKGEL